MAMSHCCCLLVHCTINRESSHDWPNEEEKQNQYCPSHISKCKGKRLHDFNIMTFEPTRSAVKFHTSYTKTSTELCTTSIVVY
ncbi:hypothetical protein ACS0TY_028425 [Phlomoides rotata]